MLILGIETSCDETAAAIVEDGVHELGSALATSSDLHIKTGGVVPEVAARKQVEAILPVIAETLRQADLQPTQLDALAVTIGPGLIGSLLVGVETAKALALAWNKPIIPVNHLVGHIYGNWVDQPSPVLPAIVLIVSGGHTDLILMQDHGSFVYLGGTVDDAAGEAFDKTARLLGLAKYLGGPQLSKHAATYVSKPTLTLPRPMLAEPNFDFSFSGLKTAVKRAAESATFSTEEIAYEFQTAVVDVLVSKTRKAVRKYDVKSVLLAGGVAANTALRTRLQAESPVKVHVPPLRLCTDNAVYIASTAFFNGVARPLDQIQANPSLGVMDEV